MNFREDIGYVNQRQRWKQYYSRKRRKYHTEKERQIARQAINDIRQILRGCENESDKNDT